MSSNVKRIFTSFLISLLGLAGTYFFFEKINPDLKFYHTQKPLAQVEKLENVSRKKLAEHRTWQVVEFGDSLYSGEMIKTSSDSELQIRFLETNATLNLEPDSAITIQRSKDQVSISLVEGHLFIDSLKNSDTKGLMMETELGSINLSKAAVNFSKSGGSKLQYNLLSGRAQRVDQNGQALELIQDAVNFSIAYPLNLSSFEAPSAEVRLKWKSKSDLKNSDLIFKTGPQRSDLKTVTPQFVAKNEALIPVRFGKNRIEVHIKDAKGVSSELSSVRFEIRPSAAAIARPAPPVVTKIVEKPKTQIVWLADSSDLQSFASKPEITFSWLVKNSESVKKVKVKILDGDRVVIAKEVDAANTQFKAFVPKAGRYVASVEALDAEANSLAQSSPRTIVAEELPFLPKPEWTRNSTDEKAELNGSFASSWNEIPGALNYKLVLKDTSGRVVKEWVQKRTYFSLKGMFPGQYTLTLSAIDLYQRESIQKATKSIKVLDSSEILAPKLKQMRFK